MNLKCPKCGFEFPVDIDWGAKIHITEPGSVISCPSCKQQFTPSPQDQITNDGWKYWVGVAVALIALFAFFEVWRVYFPG